MSVPEQKDTQEILWTAERDIVISEEVIVCCRSFHFPITKLRNRIYFTRYANNRKSSSLRPSKYCVAFGLQNSLWLSALNGGGVVRWRGS